MAKATMSQDGQLRVDLRVRFGRLSLKVLAAVLIRDTAPYWAGKYPPDSTSRTKAAEPIGEALRMHGEETEGSPHMEGDETDKRTAWVLQQVLLEHPNLGPQPGDSRG
jgi:hypothetical protein